MQNKSLLDSESLTIHAVVQRGLAPRVFEYIFKRIAEEEDNAVSLSGCAL